MWLTCCDDRDSGGGFARPSATLHDGDAERETARDETREPEPIEEADGERCGSRGGILRCRCAGK